MAVAAKKKNEEKPPNYWERLATEMTREILRRRRVRFKELSRALEAYGEDIPSTTLSNKINRGSFSFQFFLKCMYALGRSEVRFLLSDLSPDEWAAVRQQTAAQRRRVYPVRQTTVPRTKPKR